LLYVNSFMARVLKNRIVKFYRFYLLSFIFFYFLFFIFLASKVLPPINLVAAIRFNNNGNTYLGIGRLHNVCTVSRTCHLCLHNFVYTSLSPRNILSYRVVVFVSIANNTFIKLTWFSITCDVIFCTRTIM